MLEVKNLKFNPENPRIIKDENFEKLVNSIKQFPEMLKIRPVVVNEDLMVLGGDKRLKAAIEAGMEKVPTIIANGLTKSKQDEFMIKDNISAGEWEVELLAKAMEPDVLLDFGLDISKLFPKPGRAVNFAAEKDGKKTLKLKFSETDFDFVSSELAKYGKTPEEALITLIKKLS